MQLLFTIVFTLTCSAISSQPLVVGGVECITECTDGLRHGKDEYRVNGTVGPNYNEYLRNGWHNILIVQTQTTTKTFGVCFIHIYWNGTNCRPDSHTPCYCSHFDINTGLVNVSVQDTAETKKGGAILFMKWMHHNGSFMKSNNVTLPQIYDVKKAVLLMTVNDLPQKISDTCGSFLVSSSITLTLKCSDTASVCYVKLSSDDFEVENGTSVTHSFQLGNINQSVDLTASYSVCSMDNYILYGTCMINKKNDTEPGICTPLECGLGIGLGLGIPLFAATLCYFKCCKKKVHSQEHE